MTPEVPLDIQVKWCPNGKNKNFKVDTTYSKIFGLGYERRIASDKRLPLVTPHFERYQFPSLRVPPQPPPEEEQYNDAIEQVNLVQKKELLKRTVDEKLMQCWAETIVAAQKESEEEKLEKVYKLEEQKHEEEKKQVFELTYAMAVEEEKKNLARMLEEELEKQERQLDREKEKFEELFDYFPRDYEKDYDISALENAASEADRNLRIKIKERAKAEATDWINRMDEIERQYEENIKAIQEGIPAKRERMLNEIAQRMHEEKRHVIDKAIAEEIERARVLKKQLKETARGQVEMLKEKLEQLCTTKSYVSMELGKMSKLNIELRQELDECNVDIMQFFMMNLKLSRAKKTSR